MKDLAEMYAAKKFELQLDRLVFSLTSTFYYLENVFSYYCYYYYL